MLIALLLLLQHVSFPVNIILRGKLDVVTIKLTSSRLKRVLFFLLLFRYINYEGPITNPLYSKQYSKNKRESGSKITRSVLGKKCNKTKQVLLQLICAGWFFFFTFLIHVVLYNEYACALHKKRKENVWFLIWEYFQQPGR